jgi:hypothetical protein
MHSSIKKHQGINITLSIVNTKKDRNVVYRSIAFFTNDGKQTWRLAGDLHSEFTVLIDPRTLTLSLTPQKKDEISISLFVM